MTVDPCLNKDKQQTGGKMHGIKTSWQGAHIVQFQTIPGIQIIQVILPILKRFVHMIACTFYLYLYSYYCWPSRTISCIFFGRSITEL
jgi:hypothetical protein